MDVYVVTCPVYADGTGPVVVVSAYEDEAEAQAEARSNTGGEVTRVPLRSRTGQAGLPDVETARRYLADNRVDYRTRKIQAIRELRLRFGTGPSLREYKDLVDSL